VDALNAFEKDAALGNLIMVSYSTTLSTAGIITVAYYINQYVVTRQPMQLMQNLLEIV
jgi:hypothetical protein